jgi:hypothetical protein
LIADWCRLAIYILLKNNRIYFSQFYKTGQLKAHETYVGIRKLEILLDIFALSNIEYFRIGVPDRNWLATPRGL